MGPSSHLHYVLLELIAADRERGSLHHRSGLFFDRLNTKQWLRLWRVVALGMKRKLMEIDRWKGREGIETEFMASPSYMALATNGDQQKWRQMHMSSVSSFRHSTWTWPKTRQKSSGLSLPSISVGSRPSPPYRNWTISPTEFLTVRSYCVAKSSRDWVEIQTHRVIHYKAIRLSAATGGEQYPWYCPK